MYCFVLFVCVYKYRDCFRFNYKYSILNGSAAVLCKGWNKKMNLFGFIMINLYIYIHFIKC